MIFKRSKPAPPASRTQTGFARAYTQFRGSKIFLGLLILMVAGWLGAHWLFGLDPDFGGINLFLSAEASLSLAFFTIVSAMQDADTADRMRYQEKMLEYLSELSGAVHELLIRQAEQDEKRP